MAQPELQEFKDSSDFFYEDADKINSSTPGDGQCFFHAAFGKFSDGQYKVNDPNCMRNEWFRCLKQFTSLSDPNMPSVVSAQIRLVLQFFFQIDDISLAPTAFRAEGIRVLQQKIKQQLADCNSKCKQLVLKLKNTITTSAKTVILQHLLLTIIESPEPCGKKDGLMSIGFSAEILNAFDTKTGDLITVHKDTITDILTKEPEYLENRIRDNLKKYAVLLDPESYMMDTFDQEFNPETIMNIFLENTEVYTAYLQSIKQQSYYIFIEEIPILAALSNTKIIVWYKEKRGYFQEYIPNQDLLTWINSEKNKEKIVALVEDSPRVVDIYHAGFTREGLSAGMHYTRANGKELRRQLNNKAADLESLHELFLSTESMVAMSSPPDEQHLHHYLSQMTHVFKSLSRNQDDAFCIRNRFGKVNYKGGKLNPNHISFDILSVFDHISKTHQRLIIAIIQKHWTIFVEEFKILNRNIDIIFSTEELNSDIPVNAEWNQILKLTALMEFLFDMHCLQQLCKPELALTLTELSTTVERDKRVIYTFARILTLLGETCKCLSDYFKTTHLYLPLKVLSKTRDLLGHAHHGTMAEPTSELYRIQKEFCSVFPLMQQEFQTILNSFNADVCHQTNFVQDGIIIVIDDRCKKVVEPSLRLLSCIVKETDQSQKRSTRFEELVKRKKCLEKECKTLKNSLSAVGPLRKNKGRDVSEVENDLLQVNEAMKNICLFPIVDELFIHLQNKSATKSTCSNSEKFKRIVVSIRRELHCMAQLDQCKDKKRDYAAEYCMAVLRQLIRDMKEIGDELLNEIEASNPTVQNAFKEHVSIGNVLMHDPFQHLCGLRDVISNQSGPLIPDVEAMETITSHIETSQMVIHDVVQTNLMLGNAYMRLCIYDRAKEYFLTVLEFTSPESYARDHSKHFGVSVESNVTTSHHYITPSTYAVQLGCLSFIGFDDSEWIPDRVEVLYSLGSCHMITKEYKLAKYYYQLAFTIYSDWREKDGFYWSIWANLIVASCNAEPNESSDIYMNVCSEFEEKNFESFVYISIGYANVQIFLEKYTVAVESLMKLHDDKVCQLSVELRVFYHCTLGTCFGQWAKEPNDPKEKEKTHHECAINQLQCALEIFVKNKSELVKSRGNYIICLFDLINITLSSCLRSYASTLIDSNPHKAFELINKALTIQEQNCLSRIASYQTLGAVCESLHTQTKDPQYLHKACDAYGKVCIECTNTHERAVAFAGKGFVLSKLDKIQEAISCMTESKLSYSLLTESDKDENDTKEENEIKSHIERLHHSNNSEYVLVRNEYDIAGDRFCREKDFPNAVNCYKKCLMLWMLVMTDAEVAYTDAPSFQVRFKLVKIGYTCMQDSSVQNKQWIKQSFQLNKTATEDYKVGNNETALMKYKQALLYQLKANMGFTEEMGILYYNIGSVYMKQHHYDSAYSLAMFSYKIRQQLLGHEAPATQKTHTRLQECKEIIDKSTGKSIVPQ